MANIQRIRFREQSKQFKFSKQTLWYFIEEIIRNHWSSESGSTISDANFLAKIAIWSLRSSFFFIYFVLVRMCRNWSASIREGSKAPSVTQAALNIEPSSILSNYVEIKFSSGPYKKLLSWVGAGFGVSPLTRLSSHRLPRAFRCHSLSLIAGGRD